MTKRKQMAGYHEQFLELSRKNTATQISRMLGLVSSSVIKYLRVNNIKCISERVYTEDYHKEIVELVEDYYSVNDIARKLNLNSTCVRDYLKSKSISVLKRKIVLEPLCSQRFYVYGHYNTDHEMFYVGKGTGERLNRKGGRSALWEDFTSKNEWYSKILFDNLTEADSLSKEKELIANTGDLINVALDNSECDLTGLQEAFYYDKTSPSALKWKIPNGQTNHSRRESGDIAGSKAITKNKTNQGYIVGYKGRMYKVHRVVLYLHGIDCTGKVVDHIDGNPFNNKLENLRVITQSENCRNVKMRSNNTTGVTGIDLRQTGNNLYYVAKVSVNKKAVSKAFNVNRLGIVPAFALACRWRKARIAELNEQGAGYTARHGT